jgi:nucleoside-diphosphate-sugar epimerase
LEQSTAFGRPPAHELFFTSATSVYPQTDGGWVDESSPIDVSLLSPAAAILRTAEEKTLNTPAALVQRTWVLRLAGIYGPDRNHLLAALRSGQRVFGGDGSQWVNLIHRDDIVGAIRHFLATPARQPGGLYNIVDDHPVRKADLLAGLARTLGLNPADVRCDEQLASGRGGHRRNATGEISNRRVRNIKLRGAGYKLIYSSFVNSFSEGLTT